MNILLIPELLRRSDSRFSPSLKRPLKATHPLNRTQSCAPWPADDRSYPCRTGLGMAAVRLSWRLLCAAVCLLGLAAEPVCAQQAAAPSAASTAAPAPIRFDKDIVYSHAGGAELKMDIARPPASFGPGPFPVVLYFHGGGWQAGKRQDGYAAIRFLATQGFVAATVSYRFAPQFKWPDQVYDAKTAVRYVRAHAQELNIDPKRIATAGDSAGAYLALMLGLTTPADGLEGDGEWSGTPSAVQAVISFYSVTDFTKLAPSDPGAPLTEKDKKRKVEAEAMIQAYYKKTGAQVMADWSGTQDPKAPVWARISPVTYVKPTAAPVLIIQGDADPIITVEQARELDRMLTKVSVPHELLIVEGGGHGFTPAQYAVAWKHALKFLGQTLKLPGGH